VPEDGKKVAVRFFKTEAGGEPVRDWLLGLATEDRKLIGQDIKTVEFGWPIGMPTCRPLSEGLHEVRTNLKDRIARVLFCIEGETMVLLHGFIKKAQKTPKPDLDLARIRKRQLHEKTNAKGK
jgi:phage-related protein